MYREGHGHAQQGSPASRACQDSGENAPCGPAADRDRIDADVRAALDAQQRQERDLPQR